MSNDAKAVVAGILSAIALFGLMALLDWAGLDWRKWSALVMYTIVTFGYLVVRYLNDLKRRRCLAVFVALLIGHLLGSIYYLRSLHSSSFAMWIFAPFEAGIVALLLVLVGGARGLTLRKGHGGTKKS